MTKHQMHTFEQPIAKQRRPWFKIKVTLLLSVIGTMAAVLVARTDALGTLDWFTFMFHTPAKFEALEKKVDKLSATADALAADSKMRDDAIDNRVGNVANAINDVARDVKDLAKKVDQLNGRSPRQTTLAPLGGDFTLNCPALITNRPDNF